MSIFGIIGLVFLFATLFGLISGLVFTMIDCCTYKKVVRIGWITSISIFLVTWIAGVFIGIGIGDKEERVFVARYNAQKYTIEQSLKQDTLGGLERIELVKQATELNGELAERKAKFDLWYHVHYDNSIYDNVELIDLGGDK